MNREPIRYALKNKVFDFKLVVLVKKMARPDKESYFCVMNSFFQKYYTVLIKGGIITIFLAVVLFITGLTLSSHTDAATPLFTAINALSFIFCWIILAFLIHKFCVYKVLAVLALLVVYLVIPHYMGIWDNPITIPLFILFWLGVAYIVLPEFFKKYRVPILSVYGLVIAYNFFFFNMTPNHAEIHRLNLTNFMLFPIPVFAALWGYEQWRWLKKLKADKAKAELALLKSQINPHFFFNTLNNLYGLVVEKSEKAPEVVLKLSDMMRYTIYKGKEDVVLLNDEIIYLENYIELHKIRYQKKVEILFTHDVQEGLKVAPLLFIILLENAFKHGVEKMSENAFIHLRMQSQEKQLFFTIENSFDVSVSNLNNGIGLENLKKRLDYLYPNRHELIVEEKESVYKVLLNLELL